MNDVARVDEVERAQQVVHNDDDVCLGQIQHSIIVEHRLQVRLHVFHDDDEGLDVVLVFVVEIGYDQIVQLASVHVAFDGGEFSQNLYLSQLLSKFIEFFAQPLDYLDGNILIGGNVSRLYYYAKTALTNFFDVFVIFIQVRPIHLQQ